jgi:hypothetical protein
LKGRKAAELFIIMAAIGCAITINSYANAKADSVNSSSSINSGNSIFFPPDAKPYNMTYTEWAAEWWKWFVGIPERDTPAGDTTGVGCGMHQNNSHVWFLAATFVGTAKRTCEIPANKAIAVAIDGIECNSAQDGPESQLRDCAREGLDFLKHAEVQFDGQKLSDVERYRATTSAINIVFPDGAIYGAPKGNAILIGDVLLPMIRPLGPGNYSLSFKVLTVHPTNEAYNTAVDVTYDLIVK